MRMNNGRKMVVCLSLVVGTAAGMAGIDNREAAYGVITNRNAFGLVPIPPPKLPDTNPPPAPPVVVKLSGITTILTTPRVLLEYTEPGKQVQKPILTVGQRDGPIEVLEIDEKAGTVRIRNSGTETLL